MHPIGKITGERTIGVLAKVEISLKKRKAGDEIPHGIDRPHKRLFVEDHFSRDEVVQVLVERIDSLVAKNKALELRATDRNVKARENEGNLMKNACLELELEETRYRVEDKEGDVGPLKCKLEDLKSQLQENIDKKEAVEVELELGNEVENKKAAEHEVKFAYSGAQRGEGRGQDSRSSNWEAREAHQSPVGAIRTEKMPRTITFRGNQGIAKPKHLIPMRRLVS